MRCRPAERRDVADQAQMGAREQVQEQEQVERLVNDVAVVLMADAAAAIVAKESGSIEMAPCSLAWHDARDRVLCQAPRHGRDGRYHV